MISSAAAAAAASSSSSLCSTIQRDLGSGKLRNLFSPPKTTHSPRRRFSVKASRVDKFSKSDIIVSPSILSANFSKLGEQPRGNERREEGGRTRRRWEGGKEEEEEVKN